MREGERTTFRLAPEHAFGPRNPELLQRVKLTLLRQLGDPDETYHVGDVVQFPIPRPPSYLVNDPESVRRVLVGNARAYGKRTIQYRSLSLVTGDGLLVADTEEWRRQRPLVQPAFHHETLERVLTNANDKWFLPERGDARTRELRLLLNPEPKKPTIKAPGQ